MPVFIKAAAGIGASILVILALVIALLKGLLALVGLIMTAIKVLVVLAFVALLLGAGIMIFRAWSQKRKSKE